MDNTPAVIPQRITDLIEIAEGKGLVPKTFSQLWEVALVYSESGLVPKEFISKPAAIFVAMEMGTSLGLSAMASVQNIAIINGKPAVWGDAMLGIVRASGQLTSFKEYYEGVFPNADFTAICIAQRGNEEVRSEFSIADATMAGLWRYPDPGVTPWHKSPKRMLKFRARGFALRDLFPDKLKGISMAEEIAYDVELTQQPDGSYSAPEAPKAAKKSKPHAKEESLPTTYTPLAPAPTVPLEDQLKKMVETAGYDDFGIVSEYIDEAVSGSKVATTKDAVMKKACDHFDRFFKAFRAWEENKKQPKYPESDEELMNLKAEFPEEYKKACLEISDPTTAEKCEKVKKKIGELIDMAASDAAGERELFEQEG